MTKVEWKQMPGNDSDFHCDVRTKACRMSVTCSTSRISITPSFPRQLVSPEVEPTSIS
ncbi:MAG TPA: hypothetical protein VMM54_02020 [Nitrospirota bacterium]|nr:hypothetical protein [Nitrospirota bacterium]